MVGSDPRHGNQARAARGFELSRGLPRIRSPGPGHRRHCDLRVRSQLFQTADLDTLVDWCAGIASAAPEIPFYFYDIPALTGVSFPMPDFLAQGSARIPTLAGLK